MHQEAPSDSCYDLKLITGPKIFHTQSISALFFLMVSALSPRILASFYHGHLKSFSPQMPTEDMEIISAVFVGSVISEGFGK